MAARAKAAKAASQEKKTLGGRKNTYDPKRYPGIAAAMMRMGATKKDLAEAFGVAESTIYDWASKYEPFSESIKENARRANSAVVDSLFLSAQEHTVEETRTIYVADPKSPGKGKIAKTEVFKRVIPANITAVAMWLNNRDPDNWRRNPSAPNDETKDPLVLLLAGMKDKDDADADPVPETG